MGYIKIEIKYPSKKLIDGAINYLQNLRCSGDNEGFFIKKI